MLDLAAGTGKLTRALIPTGADILAVEPVAGMRETLERELPGVLALPGTAEAIPVADGELDAVVVGQAFHWFDGQAALREIHRALAQGGRLGLVWNVMDRRVAWVDRLQALIHAHRGANPWYAGHGWRAAFQMEHGFTRLRRTTFRNVQEVDLDGLIDRVASISFIATLEADRRVELDDAIRGLVAAESRLEPGRIRIPYVTDVFWCRRARGPRPLSRRPARYARTRRRGR